VVVDHIVADALDSASEVWSGVETAWMAIEWTLARDPEVGRLVTDRANVRELIYDGARSIRHPDIYVVYEVMVHRIIVKFAAFVEARASQAGHA
jgi:hypothetical protein